MRVFHTKVPTSSSYLGGVIIATPDASSTVVKLVKPVFFQSGYLAIQHVSYGEDSSNKWQG